LAVGVYVAIARLSLAVKGAVSLAARDLVAWMGSNRDADRAAMMRRIVKLERDGWVIVERATATKHRLIPTWGRDQAGTVRPWRCDEAHSGRPAHVRGRRVPLALLDDYLGRLDPQPGHGRALISRYLTRPLLDLTDVGVYTIGLRAEISPSPRLRHLGLYNQAGMLPPADNRSLLISAVTGTLTTLEGDAVVAVLLSVQGRARLGIKTPIVAGSNHADTERLYGSIRGSTDGSRDGSGAQPCQTSISAHQDSQNSVSNISVSLIAWDVGKIHESTKHDSADHGVATGGGAASGSDESHIAREQHAHILSSLSWDPPWSLGDDPATTTPALAASVIAGHRVLNPARAIHPGEWHELLALQDAYGVDQLLIWQARASRATTTRPHGIMPTYYRACAVNAAFDVYRPPAPWCASAPTGSDATPPATTAPGTPDPACDALLHSMGVRERQKLAGVPHELITAWQTALVHPGMAAQFTSPIGFAVAQMQRGNPPPPIEELDHWAERAHRKTDRYESWRHIDAPRVALDALAQEQQLEARVRALAPQEADLAGLCALANAIEAGATDAQALACLRTQHSGGCL
jgi:hypothetical protein